jgi:hypothetical protein
MIHDREYRVEASFIARDAGGGDGRVRGGGIVFTVQAPTLEKAARHAQWWLHTWAGGTIIKIEEAK